MMSSLSGTRVFRPSHWQIVVGSFASVFCLGGVFIAIEMKVVMMTVVFALFTLIMVLLTLEMLGCRLVTDGEGITYAEATRGGTRFRFAWHEVASWHLDQSDDWFVRFEFLGSRKSIHILPLWLSNPGLNEFLQEVRLWAPDQEKLSEIESFRWKVVVTTGGLYLSGKELNRHFFRWREIRSWQVHPKTSESEEDEGFVEICLMNDHPPVKIGDAFVTLPVWERLLQTLRTHADQQEVV